MTDNTLPRIGDTYRIVKDVDKAGEALAEPVLVEVDLVTKRGRGYQVHTKFGRFRLKDFLRVTEKVD